MRFSRFFIDRPIFAAVLSIVILIAGIMSIQVLPVSEYPDVVPPSVVVTAVYPGANPRVIAETVATPLEEVGQRRGQHAVHVVAGHRRRRAQPHGHLQDRHRRGPGPGPGAEPRQPAPCRGCPRRSAQIGVTTVKSSPNLTMVVHIVSPDARYDELYLRQLRGAPDQGPAVPHPRRGPGAGVRRRRLRHAPLARSAEDRGARPHRRRRRRRHPRAERAGRGRCRGRFAACRRRSPIS